MAGESRDIHLQLFAGRTLIGRLSANVPRPVEGGVVLANLFVDHERHVNRLDRTFRCDVQTDGSFRLEGLPPSPGQIVAACDGWTSVLVGGDGDLMAPFTFQPDVFAPGAGVLLTMERTADVTLTLMDAQGRAVPEATLHCWPQVFWSSGSGMRFPPSDFLGRSDASGHAELVGLPAGLQRLHVQHDVLELPLRETAEGHTYRNLALELSPGERVQLEVVLE